MKKRSKKGVPTKTDEKTILEQVPSDKMDDFVLGLMELMEKKKARAKKEQEGPYRTDVLYEPPGIIIDSAEVNDDGVVEIIEPSLSNLPSRKK